MSLQANNIRFYVMFVLFVILLIQYIMEIHVGKSSLTVKTREKESNSVKVLRVSVNRGAAGEIVSADVAVSTENKCPTFNTSTPNHKELAEDTGDWERILHMKSDKGFHSFNATASDLVGKHRMVLKDTRYEECKSIIYDICKLPKTSAIIVFHNEAWSTLLRSVHSILERTPSSLIVEIIIVDDCSTFAWLKEPLTDYVNHLPKVLQLFIKMTFCCDKSFRNIIKALNGHINL